MAYLSVTLKDIGSDVNARSQTSNSVSCTNEKKIVEVVRKAIVPRARRVLDNASVGISESDEKRHLKGVQTDSDQALVESPRVNDPQRTYNLRSSRSIVPSVQQIVESVQTSIGEAFEDLYNQVPQSAYNLRSNRSIVPSFQQIVESAQTSIGEAFEDLHNQDRFRKPKCRDSQRTPPECNSEHTTFSGREEPTENLPVPVILSNIKREPSRIKIEPHDEYSSPYSPNLQVKAKCVSRVKVEPIQDAFVSDVDTCNREVDTYDDNVLKRHNFPLAAQGVDQPRTLPVKDTSSFVETPTSPTVKSELEEDEQDYYPDSEDDDVFVPDDASVPVQDDTRPAEISVGISSLTMAQSQCVENESSCSVGKLSIKRIIMLFQKQNLRDQN